MAMIRPSRERYDPTLDLKEAGSFFARCRRIEQGIPDDQYHGKTKIAVEFEIEDFRFPKLNGQRASFVVPESVYVHPQTGKLTLLLTYAVEMGVKDAHNGFDPEKEFVGNLYYITCELYGGKARVRHAVPAAPQGDGGKAPKSNTATATIADPDGKIPF